MTSRPGRFIKEIKGDKGDQGPTRETKAIPVPKALKVLKVIKEILVPKDRVVLRVIKDRVGPIRVFQEIKGDKGAQGPKGDKGDTGEIDTEELLNYVKKEGAEVTTDLTIQSYIIQKGSQIPQKGPKAMILVDEEENELEMKVVGSESEGKLVIDSKNKAYLGDEGEEKNAIVTRGYPKVIGNVTLEAEDPGIEEINWQINVGNEKFSYDSPTSTPSEFRIQEFNRPDTKGITGLSVLHDEFTPSETVAYLGEVKPLDKILTLGYNNRVSGEAKLTSEVEVGSLPIPTPILSLDLKGYTYGEIFVEFFFESAPKFAVSELSYSAREFVSLEIDQNFPDAVTVQGSTFFEDVSGVIKGRFPKDNRFAMVLPGVPKSDIPCTLTLTFISVYRDQIVSAGTVYTDGYIKAAVIG